MFRPKAAEGRQAVTHHVGQMLDTHPLAATTDPQVLADTIDAFKEGAVHAVST
ncbi:MAG: hypothetical protein M3O70_16880 [Actinomycetota bacterium]|nr:hypothetical protein [Actinomycetota bacterium]